MNELSNEIINDEIKANKPAECEICHKIFKNKNSLAVHKSRYHKNNPNELVNNQTDNKNNLINEPIKVTQADYSKEDLSKMQNELIKGDNTAQQIVEITASMTDEDGKELYLMLMDIVGTMSNVDVEKDIPNIDERATRRGKYLAYTIKRFAPQIQEYLIPIMLGTGIAMDIISIRKLGEIKKALADKDKNDNKSDNKSDNKEVKE